MSLQNITDTITTTEEVTQYSAVTPAGDMTDAVTEEVYGVAQYGIASGDTGNLVKCGKTKCRVDGTTDIAKGDDLSPSPTAGVLIKHDGQTNTRYVAEALEAFTTNGVGVIWVNVYDRQPQAA